MTATTDRLVPQHRQQLEDSSIAPDILRERGYISAERKVDLKRLGFSDVQCNVPALVVPVYDVHGEVRLYQARPDTPRIKGGKPIKYETPAGTGLVLDVPRRIRDRLGDPNYPLWITEGAKKVDSALSHDLISIGVVGVYGWRGTNDQGGTTALADLEHIAWNGRKVYLAFDSDAMEKVEVHQALDRFASLLAGRGAEVRFVYIPSPDGRKIGLDDFLASGRTIDELLGTASNQLHALPSNEPAGEPEWEPTPDSLQRGKWLLESPDLVERAGKTIAELGVAGDLTNAKILYLALTSRFLPHPVNVAVMGPSSAGKSHTVKKVAALFPERATYTVDAMSERALVYLDADLSHRHLIVSEAAGLNRDGIGATIMRAVAWGGHVRYATVEKTAGGLRSVEIDRPGPTGLVTTSTKRVEPELETRLLILHVADTPDVTRQIIQDSAARLNRHAPTPPDLEPWHAAQWWLANEGDHVVTIPYAERLADLVPAELVRMRRDFVQITNLIAASAILHQRQRGRDELGRIIATGDDYELVHSLTADLFGAIASEGVTMALRETVAAVRELTREGDTCSIQQVARYLELARSTVDSRVRSALKGGWLVNAEESRGRPAKLKVGDALPDDKPALPSPHELFGAVENAHAPDIPDTHSSRRHVASFADRDGQNRGDDSVTSDDGSVTKCRTRDEPRFVTDSADAGGENDERDDVTTEASKVEGVCSTCGGPTFAWGLCKGDTCGGYDPDIEPF